MFGKGLSRKSVAGFAVELVIVFVGVYLAFLFSDYQEGLQDRAIRVKYYNILILELEQLGQHLMAEDRTIQQHMAVVAEMEEGLQPDLPVRHLSYTYQGIVAAAAFDNENFQSLDPEDLSNISQSLPVLAQLEDRVDRFSELATTVLLPMRASGSSAYDADGGLLAHLAWYPPLVREIEFLNHVIQEGLAERAIPSLVGSRDQLLERRFRWPS